MKNEFQKLVDHELSGLCWNERMRQHVLHSLIEEEKPVKRKMTTGMALALVLVLVGSIALAAGLMFTPRYDVVRMADEAMLETYGITDELMAYFSKRVVMEEKQATVQYIGLEDLAGIVGEYSVTVQNGKAAASWSFDDCEHEGWRADKLHEVLERCKQDGGYGAVVLEARAAAEAAGLKNAETAAVTMAEEMSARLESTALNAQQAESMALLTVEEMDRLAREAIRQRFGMAPEQLDKMVLVEESSVWMMVNDRPVYPAYYWLWQKEDGWSKGDGIYIVNVDAQTGEIDQITYDVGLLGNG